MSAEPKDRRLEWELSFPLVTNPLVLGAWFRAMSASWVLAMAIVGTLFIGIGEAGRLPLLAGIFALATAAVALLGVLIMLLLFGNRYRARFVVSEQGVIYQALERRGRALSRLAVAAGAMAGSSATAGAGLLAISREQVECPWSAVVTVRCLPRRRVVVLRDSWHDLLHLYCRRDNYDAVCELARSQVSERQEAGGGDPAPSPLPAALGRSLLVLLACLPLFALRTPIHPDPLLPLSLLLCSLAALWLLPPFGWVVVAVSGYLTLRLAWALFTLRRFSLFPAAEGYRKYQLLDGGEWLLLILALVGLGWLAWLGWRLARGRLRPVSLSD